jgi:hypothetical protein
MIWKFRFASTESGGRSFIDPESGNNTRVSGRGLGWLGFDFGLQGVFLKERLIIGGVVKDVFSVVGWDTENEAGTAKGEYYESVPISVKFGAAIKLSDDLNIYGDLEAGQYSLPPPFNWKLFEIYSDAKSRMCLGLEWYPIYRFGSTAWVKELIVFRGGYSEVLFEKDKSKIISFGSGLAFPMFAGDSSPRVSIDGGYQANSNFIGHNAFRVGISIQRR